MNKHTRLALKAMEQVRTYDSDSLADRLRVAEVAALASIAESLDKIAGRGTAYGVGGE